MHGTVVKAGRIYSAPGQKERGALGTLDKGQVVSVIGASGQSTEGIDARAWAEVEVGGLRGFTRSYRIAVGGPHGCRLDRYWGYAGWSHKPDHRFDEASHEAEDVQDSDVTCGNTYDDCDDSTLKGSVAVIRDAHTRVGGMAEVLNVALEACETAGRMEAEAMRPNVQAEILNAGHQMTLPTQDGAAGYLEPGNGTLALIDRWLLSRERRAALRSVNDEAAVVSQARYVFAGSAVRWTVVGFALYGALSLALKLVN